MIIACLIGDFSLQRVYTGCDRLSSVQQRSHNKFAFINREWCIGKRELLRKALRIDSVLQRELIAGFKPNLRGNQIVDRRLVIVDVVARLHLRDNREFYGGIGVRGIRGHHRLCRYDGPTIGSRQANRHEHQPQDSLCESRAIQ